MYVTLVEGRCKGQPSSAFIPPSEPSFTKRSIFDIKQEECKLSN
jgi:hypothetical protein